MRKFSHISESADADREYEVTLSLVVRVAAANEGEAAYMASNLKGVETRSVDVIGISIAGELEKNNEKR